MFIDASAAVAIILDEPDREELRKKLKSTRRRTMSAISSYQTVMTIRRVKPLTVPEAHDIVLEFQKIFVIGCVAIGSRFTKAALDAFERYGRGQGHRAALNMGDCFAYACARLLGVPLLCKGDGSIHTDIRIA